MKGREVDFPISFSLPFSSVHPSKLISGREAGRALNARQTFTPALKISFWSLAISSQQTEKGQGGRSDRPSGWRAGRRNALVLAKRVLPPLGPQKGNLDVPLQTEIRSLSLSCPGPTAFVPKFVPMQRTDDFGGGAIFSADIFSTVLIAARPFRRRDISHTSETGDL